MGDTLCVSRQQTGHCITPEAVREQLRRDGACGGSRMAVREDSATTREEHAAKVYRPSFSRAANSGSTDACQYATSQCHEHTPNQRQGWKLLSPCGQQLTTRQAKRDRVTSSAIQSLQHRPVPRRLHVNLGHPKNNVLTDRFRHAHATQAARNFECPACEAAKYPRVARQSYKIEVQPPLKSIAMDAKELPG